MDDKYTILYADDDNDDIQLVKDAFFKQSDNIELVAVEDGVEAIAYLENMERDGKAPCLIILDINMPRLNGKDTLKKIRSMPTFEKTPVILFTTSSQPADKEFAQSNNAGFITKPLDYRQMESVAREFIDHCSDEIRNSIIQKVR